MSPHSTDGGMPPVERRAAETRSALLGETDDVTLRVGNERERHARYSDRLLHDAAAELLGRREARVDVFDADEKRHQVGATLRRSDAAGDRLGAGVDVAVTRDRALGKLPSEQVAEERPPLVGVVGTDLEVHN